MNLAYLRHLARLGAADIHPLGAAGTAALLAAADVQPGMRVLEIGPGTGQTLLRLARQEAQVVGVDLLPEMLAAARERGRLAGVGANVSLVCGRGERLPLPANSFERVLTESALGFQDVVVAEKMLAEVWRVLSPGGLYVGNEAIWKAGVPASRIAAVNERSLADFGLRHASDAPWALAEWRQAMTQAGFEILASPLLQPGSSLEVESLSPGHPFAWHRWLRPRLLWGRWQYRRRLRRHRADGETIEGRLFVLRKPAEGG